MLVEQSILDVLFGDLPWLYCLLFGILLVLYELLRPKLHIKEPSPIWPIIPYVGHVINLLLYRNCYYGRLSASYGRGIFTLPMMGSRMYMVNSPKLVKSLQRHPKIVSFWYVEAKFTAMLGGMSKAASTKISENVKNESTGRSLLIDGLRATHKAMQPGAGVQRMLHATVGSTCSRHDQLKSTSGALDVDLWEFVKEDTTIATTDSVYGLSNPYQDRKIRRAFWDFADDAIMLIAGIWPSVTASRGHAGREVVVAAMEQYFESDGYENGSDLIRARMHILQREIDLTDMARFECVNGIALLANTVPAAFWTIWYIFSNPDILDSVRKEANKILTSAEMDGECYKTIDLSRVKELTFLTSTLYETMRHRLTGPGPRYVTEDILLDGQHLLKKDSYLVIANDVLHSDKEAWGSTVSDFDPGRFLQSDSDHRTSSAFRGFGGGANICPGKHFATMEVVANIAMLALRFEIKPVDDKWSSPGQQLKNISLAINPPKEKVLVDILPRKGYDRFHWTLKA